MSSPEHILSPHVEDDRMAVTPPPQPTGRVRPQKSTPGGVDLSVFDILNTFRRRWFLSRANLLANTISAQKAEDGKLSWVEFTPPFHSHLVKCAIALVPHPVHKVKKVMFVYILELLNGKGDQAFFDLQKAGRKVNNAQREKRRLARKRSRAAKWERDREAAKAATLPPRMRECLSCGRKFASRKTAGKHKCPDSKVVRMKQVATTKEDSQPTPVVRRNKPVALPTAHAPSAPSHNTVTPAVTGVLQETRRMSKRPRVRSPSLPIPLEIWRDELDRAFKNGEISAEDYRELLVSGVASEGRSD